MRTYKWVFQKTDADDKVCGKTVKFDGSAVGLFAYSEVNVYTCTLLDFILFTVISPKSSIFAAAAVSAFQLHCSGGIIDGERAQTRQELSNATDQYSRTLLVPSALFKCNTCYHSSTTQYMAVVTGGETISIFRAASFPLQRYTDNVPTIPISIDNSCWIPVAKVRNCVRQRLKSKMREVVALNKVEQLPMAKFVGLCVVAPPPGDHEDVGQRATTASWAARCLFNSFFFMSAVADRDNGDTTSSSAESDHERALLDKRTIYPKSAAAEENTKNPLRGGGEAGGDDTDSENGGGDAKRRAKDADPVLHGFKFSNVLSAAVRRERFSPIVRHERWSVVFEKFRAFIAEPFIGMFSGCYVDEIKKLAHALIALKSFAEWVHLAPCVRSIHVLWPMLEVLANDLVAEPESSRAFGELIIFSLHTELHMEDLWRGQMSADALRYKA